jgi:predicted ATPase/DNA-binding winged helix-turn-helix (wHTH) protein
MQRWTFGDVVVDLTTREVLRSGRAVALSPKAFQLLEILITRQPGATSKAELQERLWPQTFVVEKNLTNLVSEIRSALGDNPARPRFIRTVTKFGYVFIHPPSPPRNGDERSRTVIAPSDPPRHNLRNTRTTFVGRERELDELAARLPLTRLLTLTGMGGCGKTRLALEAAGRVLDAFDDGVWLVDLAPLSEPDLIVQRVASVFALRQQPGSSLADLVSNYLRSRRLLLILDNCDHLIPHSAQFSNSLLDAAPRLTILATSRESLGVDGEVTWPVVPLSCPDAVDNIQLNTIGRYESVQLFLARAASADPSFTLTPRNAGVVADICRSLDGIPLALELAAARLTVLSLNQIRDRLDNRFAVLKRESHTSMPRQRTLEASVDWSYDQLSDGERALMRRLAVFSGGWTIEAAERVCSGGGIARNDVLELLARLVKKSLVVVEDNHRHAGRRYRYLETIRQYGLVRLRGSGEEEGVLDRHLEEYLDLARRAEPQLWKNDQLLWLNFLSDELDNLRVALAWSLQRQDRAAQGLELSVDLVWFWIMRAYLGEGQRWLERALAVNLSPADPLRARAVTGLAAVTFFQGDLVRACLLFEDGAAAARAVDDLATTALALGLHALARLEMSDLATGSRLAGEALVAGRTVQAMDALGPALSFTAYEALAAGNVERSAQIHESLLDHFRAAGNKWAMSMSLFDLAMLRVVQRRSHDAKALAAEAITVSQDLDDRRGVAWSLGAIAGADAMDGHLGRAARLFGAMETLSAAVGAPIQPTFKNLILNRYVDSVQQALGASGYQQAVEEGRAMSTADAVSFALMDQRKHNP